MERSEGVFLLKRPGFFRWESQKPYKQLVVGTPENVSLYDPDLEQLNVYPQGTAHSDNPARLLSGDMADISEAFGVTMNQHSPDSSENQFVLTPMAMGGSYKQLEFSFDAEHLQSLSFVDGLGQTTAIEFQTVKRNGVMPESLFLFTAPEGTDVIVND